MQTRLSASPSWVQKDRFGETPKPTQLLVAGVSQHCSLEAISSSWVLPRPAGVPQGIAPSLSPTAGVSEQE